jgi:hypothetical protein
MSFLISAPYTSTWIANDPISILVEQGFIPIKQDFAEVTVTNPLDDGVELYQQLQCSLRMPIQDHS